jgi:hypothetical protein
MNDVFTIATIFVFALAILAAWAYFNTYRGVYDSLTNATPGSVYNFLYAQPLTGDFQRYLAKVVSVYKLNDWDLARMNASSKYRRDDNMFMRSPTLITCKMADGTYRQFYAERASNCYRSITGKLLFTYLF